MSHLYTDILLKIEDPTLPDRAANLLRSSIRIEQRAAVELLIKHPSPAALDLLWKLRCSLEGNEEDFLFRIQVEAALAACVKLMPEWLLRAIQRSDPGAEPFAALVYLLAHLEEVEHSEAIWHEVRETVFEKTPTEDKRALLYASEVFRDAEAIVRLTGSIHEDKDLIAPAAMRALGLIDPPKALAALDEAPLESSMLLGRSWWLPQLLAFDYDRTSEILLRKIEGHEHPWLAAAVYDGRENLITPAILDFLFGVTEKSLEAAVTEPEPERKDSLGRPFHFLASISALDLLARFEALRGTRFEEALTNYLIQQGPNDEGWHRWRVWDGIAVLQRVGGEGFTLLANYYLREAQTRLGIRDGLLLGIQRPSEETIHLIVEIANDPEKGGPTENGFPLVLYEAVKALAALGQWREMVRGCLRLGLQTPRSLPDYLEQHVWTDEQLVDALRELRSGAPSPGALLIIGFSGRLELAPQVRTIYKSSERDSDRALACLLALESLGDRESEGLFLENLDSPKTSWVAVRALLTLRTPRGDEALLDRLSHIGPEKVKDPQILAMNLLIREDTRERASRLLWQHLDPEHILYYTDDTLEYFGVLDLPEVREFLRVTAFSDTRGTWHRGDRRAAIQALITLEPNIAFQAAMALYRSDDADRLLSPEILLKINEDQALALFKETLAATHDFLLVAAIGEALDRRDPVKVLLEWLKHADAKTRQGACFAMEFHRWSSDLEGLVKPLLQDLIWDVRAAARGALDALWVSRETLRLAEEVAREKELSRRWTLVDAALTIGYPGVVAGYGAHSWFGPMIEGQPYPLRKHALSKLEEKRKRLRDELAKRERS